LAATTYILMHILFYYPSNKSSVSLETLMEQFGRHGHTVYLLCLEEAGVLQEKVKQFGVHTSEHISHAESFGYYLDHLKFLVKFIKTHKIDLVYSHTQPVNFISVFAKRLCAARFYLCRHHSDHVVNDGNKNAIRFDKIINQLGNDFIVPSRKVYEQMVEKEKVENKRIRTINYAYQFDHYDRPDLLHVQKIRGAFDARLLLATVSRFIPCKRYDILINAVADLLNEGLDIKLIILGDGPLEMALRAQVEDLQIADRIVFIGYTTKALDYMAASDMVLHISDSEASNSVVKEAGILEKIVAVCEDVGDFDDYVEDGKNGFVLDKHNPVAGLKSAIRSVYADNEKFNELGVNLKKSVFKHFSVENVIKQYTEIF